MQTLVGLLLVLLGVIAFVDRARPRQARQQYYLYDPQLGLRGRTVSALLLTAVGLLLVVTS